MPLADWIILRESLQGDAGNGILLYHIYVSFSLVFQVTPHYLTAREFFTNAYVLASLFSLAVFVQRFILQVQFYECAVLGVHLRSGIQVSLGDAVK